MPVDSSPSLNILQKYFGPSFGTKKRTTDIELPAESARDKRLPKKKKTGIAGINSRYNPFQKFADIGKDE